MSHNQISHAPPLVPPRRPWERRSTRARARNANAPTSSPGDTLLGEPDVRIIAQRALANDLADYVRFRAVCRGWRRCTEDVPRAQGCLPDPRFHPRRWIMVREDAATPPGPGSNRRSFRNVSTSECVTAELPELDGHHLLCATAEGLLVLVDESTYAVRMLNPLTRQRTELPPLPEIFPKKGVVAADALSVSGLGLVLRDSTVVVGLAGDSTVVLCCDDPSMMVVAKPGDDRWTPVDGYDDYYDINAGTCFSGHFYCATIRSIMALQATATDQPPRLEFIADMVTSTDSPPRRVLSWLSTRLLGYDGELLLSLCLITSRRRYHCEREYEVYRVDLEAGKLVPVSPTSPAARIDDYLNVRR